MKQYWPFIALGISLTGSLLIAIFRNQLSRIGDSLAGKSKEIKEGILILLAILITVGGPLYMFLFGYNQPVTSRSVMWMVMGMSLLVLNFALFTTATTADLERKRFNQTRQLIEDEKQANMERFKVMRFYVDHKLKMEKCTDPKQLEELQKEFNEFYEKHSHIHI